MTEKIHRFFHGGGGAARPMLAAAEAFPTEQTPGKEEKILKQII